MNIQEPQKHFGLTMWLNPVSNYYCGQVNNVSQHVFISLWQHSGHLILGFLCNEHNIVLLWMDAHLTVSLCRLCHRFVLLCLRAAELWAGSSGHQVVRVHLMDRLTLCNIAEELDSSEVAALCFLCLDVVGRRDQEGVSGTTYTFDTCVFVVHVHIRGR